MPDKPSPIPPCEKCGKPRKRIGFLPYADDRKRRIDLYVCTGCGERSDAVSSDP
jgi:hypothetical protein